MDQYEQLLDSIKPRDQASNQASDQPSDNYENLLDSIKPQGNINLPSDNYEELLNQIKPQAAPSRKIPSIKEIYDSLPQDFTNEQAQTALNQLNPKPDQLSPQEQVAADRARLAALPQGNVQQTAKNSNYVGRNVAPTPPVVPAVRQPMDVSDFGGMAEGSIPSFTQKLVNPEAPEPTTQEKQDQQMRQNGQDLRDQDFLSQFRPPKTYKQETDPKTGQPIAGTQTGWTQEAIDAVPKPKDILEQLDNGVITPNAAQFALREHYGVRFPQDFVATKESVIDHMTEGKGLNPEVIKSKLNKPMNFIANLLMAPVGGGIDASGIDAYMQSSDPKMRSEALQQIKEFAPGGTISANSMLESYDQGQNLLGENIAGKTLGIGIAGLKNLFTLFNPIMYGGTKAAQFADALPKALNGDLSGANDVIQGKIALVPFINPKDSENQWIQFGSELLKQVQVDPVNTLMILEGAASLGTKMSMVRLGRLGKPMPEALLKAFGTDVKTGELTEQGKDLLKSYNDAKEGKYVTLPEIPTQIPIVNQIFRKNIVENFTPNDIFSLLEKEKAGTTTPAENDFLKLVKDNVSSYEEKNQTPEGEVRDISKVQLTRPQIRDWYQNLNKFFGNKVREPGTTVKLIPEEVSAKANDAVNEVDKATQANDPNNVRPVGQPAEDAVQPQEMVNPTDIGQPAPPTVVSGFDTGQMGRPPQTEATAEVPPAEPVEVTQARQTVADLTTPRTEPNLVTGEPVTVFDPSWISSNQKAKLKNAQKIVADHEASQQAPIATTEVPEPPTIKDIESNAKDQNDLIDLKHILNKEVPSDGAIERLRKRQLITTVDGNPVITTYGEQILRHDMAGKGEQFPNESFIPQEQYQKQLGQQVQQARAPEVIEPTETQSSSENLNTLRTESLNSKSINDITGKDSGLLFHGTTSDRNFNKFNLEKSNFGVSSNAFAQGNKGIYLTDSVQASRYFSRKAGEFNILHGSKYSEDIQSVFDKAWEKLFGDKDGNIIAVKLDDDAKIKDLNYSPDNQEIEEYKKQGFDAVRFPEDGFKNIQDYPNKFGKESYQSALNSTTTFVFNPEKIQIIKNIPDLDEFQRESKSIKDQMSPTESGQPVVSPEAPKETVSQGEITSKETPFAKELIKANEDRQVNGKPISQEELRGLSQENREQYGQEHKNREGIHVSGRTEGIGQEVIPKPPETPQEPPQPPVEPPSEPSAQPAEAPKSPTSIQNSVVDQERQARGLPPLMKEAQRDFGTVWNDALAKIDASRSIGKDAADDLIKDLKKKPRATTDEENAILLHKKIEVSNSLDKVNQKILDAHESGDQSALVEGRFERARLEDSLVDIDEVSRTSGTELGRGLNARKMMANEDFSLAKMVVDKRAANDGRPLTDAEHTHIADLHKKIGELQSDFAKYKASSEERFAKLQVDKAIANLKKIAPEAKPKTATILKFIDDQASAAMERIRARRGRAMAGLDPAEIADHVIVGASFIAKGAIKFGEWSAQMVKEFGDYVKPHLQEIFDKATEEAKSMLKNAGDEQKIKAAISSVEKSIADIEDRIKNNDLSPRIRKSRTLTAPELDAARAKRDSLNGQLQGLRTISKLQEKIANKDFSTIPRNEKTLEPKAMKMKADIERVKQQYKQELAKDRLKNRGWKEKLADALVKWNRFSILSGTKVLEKLSYAALARFAITPLEELHGEALHRAFPELSKLAPRHGGGMLLRAESKALTEGFTTGMKYAYQKLRTGHTDLGLLYGGKMDLPQDFLDIPGNIHGALKTPVHQAEFARSFEKRIFREAKLGVDVTDELVQTRIAIEAYEDAERSIFMQKNIVTNALNRGLKSLEEVNKKTGKPTLGGKLLATAINVEMPIKRVPTNIIAETMEYAIGTLTGSVKLANAYREGISKLSPQEADLIFRHLKKGNLGAAVMLTSFLTAWYGQSMFGGFYQPHEKRKKGEIKADEARIGGIDIASQKLHFPLAIAAQLGATIARVADSKLRQKDKDTQGLTGGAIAGALGLADSTPFVSEMTEIEKLRDPNQRSKAWNAKLSSIFVPQGIKEIAQLMDKDEEGNPIQRDPTSLLETIESGIPVLRQNVPVKKEPASSGYRPSRRKSGAY